jgi:redox-sensing transcriptional repressor
VNIPLRSTSATTFPLALVFTIWSDVVVSRVEKISELTTMRLSIYLRCLKELAAEGASSVSSEAMAKRYHLNSAQIRKDLANFGEFGVRGVGYNISQLSEHLVRILGLDREHNVAIIGAGRLGMALADYYGFRQTNFTVNALFDADKSKVGKKVGDIEIINISELSRAAAERSIDVAVIAVPAQHAQAALDTVVAAGVKAVLNFAPVPIKAPADVKVKSIDLTTAFESLSYFLSTTNGGE